MDLFRSFFSKFDPRIEDEENDYEYYYEVATF